MTLKVPTTRQEYLDLVGIYENTLWLANAAESQVWIDRADKKVGECERLFEQCKFYIDEDGLWCEKEEKQYDPNILRTKRLPSVHTNSYLILVDLYTANLDLL